MFWIARILAVLALLAVLVYGVGLLIPAERVITKTTIIDAPAARVFQTMTDVERQPKWRGKVRTVEVETRGKLWSWTETHDDGAKSHVQELVKEPLKRYEIEFHNSSGIHGQWVAELEPSNESRTKMTCTETLILDRPFFRLPAYLLINVGSEMDKYLGDLNRESSSETEEPTWSPIPRPTATPTATPAVTPLEPPPVVPSASATPTAVPSATPSATPKSAADAPLPANGASQL